MLRSSRNRIGRKLAICLACLKVALPDLALASSFEAEMKDGRLSVATAGIPGRELLVELGELGGFEVRIIGEPGEVGPDSFRDLPVDEAIERLFKRSVRSLVILYDEDDTGNFRVAKVRISAREPTPALAPGAPATSRNAPSRPRAVVAELRSEVRPPPPPTFLPLPPPPPRFTRRR